MNRYRQLLLAGGLLVGLLGCTSITISPSTTPASTTEATPSSSEPTLPPDVDPNTPPGVIVIEGPVEQINLNIITIANTQIEVNINDPIFSLIEVGDVIQIEGTPIVQNNVVIIQVINIISIQKNVVIIDTGTNPLPEGCKITKKGHIKCTKKKR